MKITIQIADTDLDHITDVARTAIELKCNVSTRGGELGVHLVEVSGEVEPDQVNRMLAAFLR